MTAIRFEPEAGDSFYRLLKRRAGAYFARTGKTVTTQVHGKTVRRGLNVWNGVEQFSPFGRYSMAPIVGADDLR